MRRFEFQSGSSSKFWEIALEGSLFTVRWGKLGTSGQQQEKSFASAALAQKEHDKLVAEKLKKGYQEVAASDAPPLAVALPVAAAASAARAPVAVAVAAAPAQVAAQLPPPKVTPAAGQAVDLDKLERKAIAYRGGPVGKPGTDLKKAIARLQQVRELDARKHVMTGKDVDIEAALKPALMERVARGVGEFQAGDPKVEAVFLAMMGHNSHAWERAHEIGSDMVHLWLSQAPPLFALQALLANFPYDEHGRLAPKKNWGYFPFVGPWRTLRGYLAAASEADYQAARAEAEQHLDGAPSELRFMLAFLFPGEPFSQSIVEESLQHSSCFQHIPLLSTATTGKSFSALCELARAYIDHDYLGFKFLDYLPAAVLRLGVEAAPGLLVLARGAEKAGSRRALADLLLHLITPEVHQFFEEHRKDKVISPQALSYLERESPPAPAPVARAAEAEAHALPQLLASPPWLNPPAKKKAAAKPQLAELSYEEKVHFAEGQREKLVARNDICTPTQFKKIIEEFPKSPYLVFAERLCDLCDREWAIQAWNETPSEHWNIYSFRSEWDETPQRLLATFDTAILPGLLRIAPMAPDKCYPALSLVESPRVAPLFAELRARSKKFRALAQKWLKTYPRAAAQGLIAAALKGGKNEVTALRWLASQGESAALLEVAQQLGGREAVAELLDYDPLHDLPTRIPAKPAWWKPERYVRPRLLNGNELPLSALEHLGTMLSISRLDEPYAGLEQVASLCQPASLEEFAWSVYQSWLQAGGPAKEDWGFLALGFFGGDEVARRLTPEIRRWPGDGLSARASLGLEVLGKIGTDVALMHLHGIALKLRFKALQDKARLKIEEIAEQRGLTLDELADRLVPDLDLDDKGQFPLDFGPRQFQVRFDEQLRPSLFDADGRALKDLPGPNKQDDATLAAAAVEAWKALKKDLKTVAATQLERLEQALAKSRRWPAEDFQLLLASHPLLGHLVRRLLWAVHADGRVQGVFRVAEDGSLADVDDRMFSLNPGAQVGLVHPLEANLAPWAAVLDDYHIVQPFPQVHRPVFAGPAPDFRGRKARPGRILRLEKRGWHRGSTESGCLLEFIRSLAHGQAVIEILDGGYLEELARNEVEVGKLQLPETITAVELSEVLYDLSLVFEP